MSTSASTTILRQCTRAQGRGRGRGRGRGGRGRGRSQGRGRQSTDQQQQNSKGYHHKDARNHDGGRGSWDYNRRNKPIPPPRVITSDFLSMHLECMAGRYKVHRPRCDCSKIKSLWSMPAEEEASNGGTITDAGGKEEVGNDGFKERQLDQVGVVTWNPSDGLVVLPEIKNVRSFYLCLGTGQEAFNADPRRAELKLKEEVFPPKINPDSVNTKVKTADECNDIDDNKKKTKKVPNFKVSCAACLLEIVPNGFACVSSPSISAVEFARDMARKRAAWKQKEGLELHADHAHFVCALSRQSLWKLETAKTRSQKNAICTDIYAQMRAQGLPALSCYDETTKEKDEQIPDCIDIGHHLSSLLRITTNDSNQKNSYWLVIVYDDRKDKRKRCWSIDLPGGKRHLGETAFEGAIRETEEECSLQIAPSWIVGGKPRQSKKDNLNAYFMLCPPSSLMVDNITENPFWHNEGFADRPE